MGPEGQTARPPYPRPQAPPPLTASPRTVCPTDTTVVYFVQPTERNVKKICQDIQDQKYDKYQLNFISRISREQLELLAQSTLESQSVNTIEKVYDMYSNFICLESDFFMLRQQVRAAAFALCARHLCIARPASVVVVVC